MKPVNILILLIVFISPVMADTRFEELFYLHAGNATATADRVTSYHADNINISSTEKLTELNALSHNLDAFIKASPENAVLWFLKGLNYSNHASVYSAQNNSAQVEKFITQKNRAYEKAMQLDQSKNTLTAAVYAAMKHGLPENLKITAIQKELSLGGNGENESSYWYLHWSNISALEQAGRTDEAKQAFNNMKAEMLEQGISNPDYNELTTQIEHSIKNQAQTKKQKPTPVNQKSPVETRENKIVSLEDLTWLLITLVVIALILAWKYEMLIFKKRR